MQRRRYASPPPSYGEREQFLLLSYGVERVVIFKLTSVRRGSFHVVISVCTLSVWCVAVVPLINFRHVPVPVVRRMLNGHH